MLCFALYLFESSTFALKMTQICQAKAKLPSGCRRCGVGTMARLTVCLPTQNLRDDCGDRGGLPKAQGVRGPAEDGLGRPSVGEVFRVCHLSGLRPLAALIKVTFIGCEMFAFVR